MTGAQDAALRGRTPGRGTRRPGVAYDEAYAYTEGVRRGGALVGVESSDDQAERGMEILRQSAPGQPPSADDPVATGGLDRRCYSTPGRRPRRPRRPARRSGHAPQGGTDDTEVRIPVVDEEISVGTPEGRAWPRAHRSRVTEHPVEEAVRLREETVTVERRPVDRPATEADFAAAGKDVIEMTRPPKSRWSASGHASSKKWSSRRR